MTAREWTQKNRPNDISEDFAGGVSGCPHTYIGMPDPSYCLKRADHDACTMCWNRDIPEVRSDPIVGDEKVEHPDTDTPKKYIPNLFYQQLEEQSRSDEAGPRILDSGNRRQFESGAVRDIQEGKGRCDLLPLDVVAEYYVSKQYPKHILYDIREFMEYGNVDYLFKAIQEFSFEHFKDDETMLLEVAKHFEEGCKKYGENNWQKGIPVHCYIDSGVRHYLKFLRGDKDEPHDRAFCWNMMCAIWTAKHKPELNEYRKETE